MRKEFTTQCFKDNTPLKQFAYKQFRTIRNEIVGDSLYDVYNINNAIKVLERLIKKHSDRPQTKKNIVKWEGYIKIIKGLKNV